jgi:hypothetical protein
LVTASVHVQKTCIFSPILFITVKSGLESNVRQRLFESVYPAVLYNLKKKHPEARNGILKKHQYFYIGYIMPAVFVSVYIQPPFLFLPDCFNLRLRKTIQILRTIVHTQKLQTAG